MEGGDTFEVTSPVSYGNPRDNNRNTALGQGLVTEQVSRSVAEAQRHLSAGHVEGVILHVPLAETVRRIPAQNSRPD